MLFYFYGRNTPKLSLYCGRLNPRWFKLGVLEILSIRVMETGVIPVALWIIMAVSVYSPHW